MANVGKQETPSSHPHSLPCVSVRLILDANLLIRRWLIAKRLSRRSHGMLNLKDLLATFPATVGPPFGVLLGDRNRRGFAQSKGLANRSSAKRCGDLFGFFRATQTWRCLSTDSTTVVGQVAEEGERTLAKSKGLTDCVSAEP